MKVLAVNGSGRSAGNNYNILKSCLESLDTKSCSSELIQLGALSIKACQSCYLCKSEGGKCPIKDDMTHITQKVLESDLLIISTPVYMWQISAQTKLFIERLYPLYHFDRPSELKGKKLILIFTQATPDKDLFKAYFEHISSSMRFLGFDVINAIVMSGLRNTNDYTAHPEFSNILSELVNKEGFA